MKRILSFTIIISVFFTVSIRAGEKLIAYPVPFDPDHQSLRLKFEPDRTSGSVHIDIYDINGSLVFKRDYSSISSFLWKGYNDNGRSIGNGLYIIKSKWEDSSTGKVSVDTVRITVIKRKQ